MVPTAMWQHPHQANPHLQPFAQIPSYLGTFPHHHAAAIHMLPHGQLPQITPAQPVFQYQTGVGSAVPVSMTEVSPTNSERSSPSQSPHTTHQVVRKQPPQSVCSDSSSDDGDRGKVLI